MFFYAEMLAISIHVTALGFWQFAEDLKRLVLSIFERIHVLQP